MTFFLLLPIAALIALLLFWPMLSHVASGRWAIVGLLLGAASTGGLTLYGIFHSTSSTAAIGILFVPFAMVFGAAAGAILGFAAFEASRIGERRRDGPVGIARSLVALALLTAALAWGLLQAGRVASFHRYQRAGNPQELAAAAERNLRTKDYFVLSAIAGNANTPPEILLEMARYPDPGLHRKRQEWINLFGRDQLAVLRKVVRNPHSPTEVLPILSQSSDDYVLADVCGDKRTSEQILRTRCAARNIYLVHWSLAANAGTPPDLLAALPRNSDKYVAHHLAYNPSTPLPILAELARHQDPMVRQGVAVNPSTGSDLLAVLARDPVEYVSRQARIHFARLPEKPAKAVVEPKTGSAVH